MAQAQMIEGTIEEITAALPPPPFTVHDQAHLETLLLKGVGSPVQPFTEDTLEQMRQEVRNRRA